MPSITTWNRIKPNNSSDQLDRGLEARIHDPVWLLTRQWQMGEFNGEDAGSPIDVSVTTSTTPIDQYRPHNARSNQWRDYDSEKLPLEQTVEREVNPLTYRERIDSGLYLLALLRDNPELHSIVTALYAFQAPTGDEMQGLSNNEQMLVSQSAGVAIDGLRVASSEASPLGDQIASAGIDDPGNQVIDVIELALGKWHPWFHHRFPGFDSVAAEDSAWNPHRMEYQFSVQSSLANIELEAEGYTGEHLDWYAFKGKLKTNNGTDRLENVEESERPSAEPDDKQREKTFKKLHLMPTPLMLPGQPATRWWQFEDRQVGFGDINTSSADLATLILLEYAVAYGEDWYLIPIEVPVGSLCETTNLQVSNTFNETHSISPARQHNNKSPWTLFTLSGLDDVRDSEFLFLPPSLPTSRLEGKPLERISFRKDEMANMAWAIEQRIEQATGHAIDRQELVNQQTGAHTGEHVDPGHEVKNPVELDWKLGTPPHAAWFPLVINGQGPDRKLMLTRMQTIDGQLQQLPSSKVLTELSELDSPHILPEELEQSGGSSVTRHAQFSRWNNGSRHTWKGRKKLRGGRDTASGLSFDKITLDFENKNN